MRSRLRKGYVAASSVTTLPICQGAPKRSDGGLRVRFRPGPAGRLRKLRRALALWTCAVWRCGRDEAFRVVGSRSLPKTPTGLCTSCAPGPPFL